MDRYVFSTQGNPWGVQNTFSQRWHKILTTSDTTKVDYKFLCDVDIILGLSCVVPMLKVVEGLSKFAQN